MTNLLPTFYTLPLPSVDTVHNNNYQTKPCLLCNTSYYILAESSTANEFGTFYLRNVSKILDLTELEAFESVSLETQPFCSDCKSKLAECYRLQSQLDTMIQELEKLRYSIGKSVVNSFGATSYLRSNYDIKRKIFEKYYPKIRDGSEHSPLADDSVSASDFSELSTAEHEFGSVIAPTSKENKEYITTIKRNNVLPAEQNSVKVSALIDTVKKSISKRKSNLNNTQAMPILTIAPIMYSSNVNELQFVEVDFVNGPQSDAKNSTENQINELSSQIPTEQTTKKFKYQCKYCGKVCSKSNHLVIHERTHTGERPFPCPVCNKAFREKGHLLRHEKTHDKTRLLGEKNHLCPECGRGFVLADSLYNHRREKHLGKPQRRNNTTQICEACGKILLSSKSLRKHIMVVHEKQKPYVCATCGKKFAYLRYQKLHILNHHNFICPEIICSSTSPDEQPTIKIFKFRKELEEHYTEVHPGTPIPSIESLKVKAKKSTRRLFECGQCSRSFSRRTYRDEHFQKYHTESPNPENSVINYNNRTKGKLLKRNKRNPQIKANPKKIKHKTVRDANRSEDDITFGYNHCPESATIHSEYETELEPGTKLKRSARIANKQNLSVCDFEEEKAIEYDVVVSRGDIEIQSINLEQEILTSTILFEDFLNVSADVVGSSIDIIVKEEPIDSIVFSVDANMK